MKLALLRFFSFTAFETGCDQSCFFPTFQLLGMRANQSELSADESQSSFLSPGISNIKMEDIPQEDLVRHLPGLGQIIYIFLLIDCSKTCLHN